MRIKEVSALPKANYQLLLEREIEKNQAAGKRPRLLLHACCAPCSSYVLEYLSRYFAITLFYYNPNIAPESEYRFRVEEVERLLRELPEAESVTFVEGQYDTERFFALAKGHETEEEGGERCFACYRLRLGETASYAKEHGFDYFTTTLSISPYKNAEKLNTIGGELAQEYGVPYLFSDFKKRDGYRRSIALSAQYSLYRQDYCGCVFSKQAAERKKDAAQKNGTFPDRENHRHDD